ncbi:AraC family transcriptional regulator [Pseudonocardia sp. TRM90224]|uniref:AraC family transcriptional regulator n=1 Tax=Pseudonocardia sp. TRM90224 TaxID=2812678 RepID=UPI001E59864F|nr:helix-turn-helix domain-containing protein [Pseudonocardia sp. TRM90224]
MRLPRLLPEVVTPAGPGRIKGLSMAGFSHHGSQPLAMQAIPHPAVTVVFDLDPGTVIVDGPAGRQQGSILAGLAFQELRVGCLDLEALQVRLSPLLAHAVLGVPPTELEGAVIALDDLWGRGAARLQERLSETRSWPDRFHLVEDLVSRRVAAGRSMPGEVAVAWDRIVHSGGRVRAEELAAQIGWSRQHLWTRFRSHIGLSPRRAAKLVRFHHAAHWLAAGRGPARVAADTGYFDQSHLHRDVQAFTGTTPGTVARKRSSRWTPPVTRRPAKR